MRRVARGRGALAAAAGALVLAGCVDPGFRTSVGQFGTVTKTTVAAQDQRLAALVAAERERIHAGFAADRVDLRIDPACAAAVQADPSAPAPPCGLVRADGKPLDQPPPTAHIVALGAALSAYADQLIALAADPDQDRQAFTASVAKLGTSLGGLEAALRQASGGKATGGDQRLGAVAAVVAAAGNLALTAHRDHVLRRIVIEADPIVQKAAGFLADAQRQVAAYNRADLFGQLQAAQQQATRLAATGAAPADLRAAQDHLFDTLAAFNAYGTDFAPFEAIAAAHHRLAQAAAKTSPAAMASAIQSIIALAGTIEANAAAIRATPGNP